MPQVSENHIYGGYSFRNNARTVAEIEILRVKTRLHYLLMWRTKVLCLLWEVKNSLCTPGNHKPKWPLAEGVFTFQAVLAVLPKSTCTAEWLMVTKRPVDTRDFIPALPSPPGHI